MRITNKMLSDAFLSNLRTNLEQMKKYQDQLSSGKEFRRPSDDPFRVARSMSLYNMLSQNEQYKRNIENSIGWVDASEKALGQLTDTIQRVRELTLRGSNGSLADEDRYAVKAELEQLIKQTVQVLNANFDGRYIFGGYQTGEAPFEENDNLITYSGGNSEEIKREIAQNVTISVNVAGNVILHGKDGDLDLAATLKNILEKVETGDSQYLSNTALEELDDNLENILTIRADLGAKSKSLEIAKDKNEEEVYNLTELLSKNEDIDLAEKVMQYKTMEAVYFSTLQTGAKILQPSLLDFLR